MVNIKKISVIQQFEDSIDRENYVSKFWLFQKVFVVFEEKNSQYNITMKSTASAIITGIQAKIHLSKVDGKTIKKPVYFYEATLENDIGIDCSKTIVFEEMDATIIPVIQHISLKKDK